MLCALKIRGFASYNNELSYRLRITAKHAVGGAGGLLADEESYTTPADLLSALRNLKAPDEVVADAAVALADEGIEDHWAVIAAELQIPFDTLAANGFSLEADD